MFQKLFGYDNVVFRFLTKLGNIWWLNILWLVCSLPVFTLGASTTALIYSSMKLHDDEGYPAANFFRSFRENFRQATGLFFIYAAAGILIALDLIYWNRMDNTDHKLVWALTIVVLIPYCLSLLYVFAVQSKFVHTVKGTIYYSFMLSIRHFKETVMMLIVMGIIVYLNLTTIVLVNYVTLLLGVGLIAYLFSVYYIKIFKKYIPVEPAEPEEPD